MIIGREGALIPIRKDSRRDHQAALFDLRNVPETVGELAETRPPVLQATWHSRQASRNQLQRVARDAPMQTVFAGRIRSQVWKAERRQAIRRPQPHGGRDWRDYGYQMLKACRHATSVPDGVH